MKRRLITALMISVALPATVFGQDAATRHVAKFTISPETTVVDGPLHEDGTINYVAVLNKMMGEGAVDNDKNGAPLLLSVDSLVVPA